MSKIMLKSQQTGDITSPRRKFLLFCLWAFWLLLLIGALLLCYGWTQRYSYLETAAKRVLAENNIAAELKVIDVTRTGLRLDGVELRDIDAPNEAPFFSAERVEARYAWKEALNGKVDAIIFTRPEVMIEIDAAGKIIGGWVPPTQSDDETSLTFPKDGLSIIEGRALAASPYGVVSSSIDAVIFGPRRFEASLELEKSVILFQGNKAMLSGPLSIVGNEAEYKIDGDLQFSDVSTKAAYIDQAHLTANLSVSETDGDWTGAGPLSVTATGLKSDSFQIGRAAIKSGGIFMLPKALDGQAGSFLSRLVYEGDIDVDALQLGLTHEALRNQLATTLSLSDVLSKSPILSQFAPTLKNQTQTLLEHMDVTAILELSKMDAGLTIAAKDNVVITQGGKTWSVSPAASGPFISLQADPDSSAYNGKALFDFKKPAPLPLSLLGGEMDFTLTPEVKFGGVDAFSGQVSLPQTWRAKNTSAQAVSLSAPRTDIAFSREGAQSRFAAKTGFALTGNVPGGYVKELRGQGAVLIDTQAQSSRLQFTSDKALTYDKLDLTSGWIVEDGSLHLADSFIMEGPPERRIIDVIAKDLSMRVHDNDVRDFQVTMAGLDGQGILSLEEDLLSQDWSLSLRDGRMASAEFPLADTNIFSPAADIKVSLSEGAQPIFDIKAPATQVQSSLISTDDIAVEISGTPENLTVDYDAKLFRFADPSLPQIPMAGQTRLVGTQWTGESVARLPEDPATPIDISFIFEDGIGSADVNIETLKFTRQGLQPQNLVKSLSGKIGGVEGSVSTAIKLEFGEGRALKSYGTTTFNNLDFGVLAGTVQGLNGDLEFTSFFPLETSGRQTLKLRSFDPGFPLPEGEVEFELLPGKMKIHRAEWAVGEGSIYIEPLLWDFEALENRAVLAVDNVVIQDVIKKGDDSKLEITGAMSGRLPILVSGVNVNVEDGRLSVPTGGNIRFNHTGTDLAGAQNQAVGVAFDALKDFEYDLFELDVNGPLDGLVRLRTVFSGSNKEVYGGQPFEFDVELEGELLNLMRNLNPETHRDKVFSGEYYDLAIKERAQQTQERPEK